MPPAVVGGPECQGVAAVVRTTAKCVPALSKSLTPVVCWIWGAQFSGGFLSSIHSRFADAKDSPQ